ncbi:hypothetical protein [Bordetella genomosp. 13]|uniref:hypothetical protein n=1 Tax=Bordetella genomosp. 13 TaxID=463040 RepID=UPI0011A0E337|nr:hypothetical protein [Bordetella genomosp. 13]
MSVEAGVVFYGKFLSGITLLDNRRPLLGIFSRAIFQAVFPSVVPIFHKGARWGAFIFACPSGYSRHVSCAKTATPSGIPLFVFSVSRDPLPI